jgi:hypothetical protein
LRITSRRWFDLSDYASGTLEGLARQLDRNEKLVLVYEIVVVLVKELVLGFWIRG